MMNDKTELVKEAKNDKARRCCWSAYQKRLEIWGKAQRESARRPKSDWGKLRGEGGKVAGRISPASKSRGPNSNALVYAERALST